MSRGIGRGYADLCVRCSSSRQANLRLLRTLAEGGFERVALAHHVTLTKGVQLKPAPPLKELLDSAPLTKGGRPLEVLQRLTVSVEDASLLHALSSPAAESYDVLSVRPSSDKVFRLACSVLPVDVVCVDLSERVPFTLKYTQLSQAVERGVFLEICYSSALKGNSARRCVIANAQDLVKGSKGNNILVSSDAEKALEVRSPLDVVNLCHLFGLTDSQCKAAITSVSRAVLMHAHMRRHSAKGVISSKPVRPQRKRRRNETEEEEAKEAKEEKEEEEKNLPSPKRLELKS